MSDSIRAQIISAVKTRLEGILTPAYNTDLGNNVYVWRATDLQASELPAAIIRDMASAISPGQGWQQNDLSVEIQLAASSAANTVEDVRSLIQDIYAAIATDETWSGLAMTTQPEGDSMEIDQAGAVIGSATVKIVITYISSPWAI